MTLEWLLIVGAIAGLAASSVLVVQRVVDDTAEAPDDPRVRLLEADIAAALIADEANQAKLAQTYGNSKNKDLRKRCQQDLPRRFPDVVQRAIWEEPRKEPDAVPLKLKTPARCAVTPKPNLGGR